jgi:hypothetical protein
MHSVSQHEMKVSGQLHAPVWGNSTHYPKHSRLHGPHASGEKNPYPCWNQTLLIQLLASLD